MSRTHRSIHMALLIMLVGLASCSEEPEVLCKNSPCFPPYPPSGSPPYPGTRDVLVSNLKLVYEDMNYDEFRDLMTPDYLMVLQQSTIDDFPDVGEFLERDEELRIHQRLFAGDPVTDPGGNLVPAIASISFEEFRQLGKWGLTEVDHLVPQADSAIFQVDFLFTRPGFLDIQVKGQLEFYAVSRDSLHEGILQPYWQLAGIKDLTESNKRSASGEAFGSVKALFR